MKSFARVLGFCVFRKVCNPCTLCPRISWPRSCPLLALYQQEWTNLPVGLTILTL